MREKLTFDKLKCKEFELPMPGINKKQLDLHCRNPWPIPVHKHFYCGKKNTYRVPGNLLVKFLQPAVFKLYQTKKDFPVKILRNSKISHSTTFGNFVYIKEDLLFKLKFIHLFEKNDDYRFVCNVQFTRNADEKVVFFVTLEFTNFEINEEAFNKE